MDKTSRDGISGTEPNDGSHSNAPSVEGNWLSENAHQVLAALNKIATIEISDRSGVIQSVNSKFTEVFGYAAAEVIGKTHSVISSRVHPKEFFENLWNTILSGQVWQGEIENRTKEGHQAFIRSVIVPIKDDLEQVLKFLTLSFDVTQQRLLERKIARAKRMAKVAYWSYDFKTQRYECEKEVLDFFEMTEEQANDFFRISNSKLHPEDQEKRLANLTRYLGGQEARAGMDSAISEFRVVRKDSTILHLRAIYQTDLDRTGTPIRFTTILQDITDLCSQREELRKNVELNRAIQASARFSIISTSLDGTITSLNDEAARIIEYAADELIGKHSPSLFHDPKEVAAVAELLSKESGVSVPVGFETFVFKANQGKFDERQWTYISKTGRRTQVRLSVTALRDTEGGITGYLGIAKDLTEELAIKNALEEERARSIHQAKLASLGEMSAGVAHEINNPLAIISAGISMLGKYRDQPEQFVKKTEAIAKATARITKIVNSLRTYSRSTSSGDRKFVPVDKIISEVLILTEGRAKRADVPITVKLEEGLCLLCDEIELEQVLVNLINNAVDAVKPLPEKWVRITGSSTDDRIFLRIIDSGDGISSDLEGKIFKPFFTTKAAGQGTGLGLSISKKILEGYGATLSVNPHFRNTCFEIAFPINKTIEKKKLNAA